jgi:predicted dehydrogenase/threonine dehydrogenase-like Zn-dependent dehydrogenase
MACWGRLLSAAAAVAPTDGQTMKQVTQRLRDGTIEVLEVPMPALTPGTVLVDVRASLLSVGTERAKVEAGKKSLLGKARSRPDQVAKVIEKARDDGLSETVRAVRARLDQPSALGYSAAGVVLAVGERVTGLAVGDRVAIGGGDYAVHAEIDRVPGNLCVAIPESVGFDEACFACVGSIALHGVRQAEVGLGERVAVIGLGLVGQITGQILRAAGCTVVGIDLDGSLAESARENGAVDTGFARDVLDGDLPQAAAECDAVIVTAATPSNDPVEIAPRLCRDRGRVVIVGDVGMQVPRAPYYEKEIDLRLSRSYGPGRYDRSYEERGNDYPIGYVRWTEARNMSAIVEQVGAGRLPVSQLITARIPVGEAASAYAELTGEGSSPLGIVIEYPESPTPETPPRAARSGGRAGFNKRASLIGTGSFTQRVLLPGLRAAGFEIDTVAGAAGLSARATADRIGSGEAGSPDDAVASDAGLLVIATRHDSHADLAERGMLAGKAVFVEKPPCLNREELERLRAARAQSGMPLVVGFNRRHARLSADLKGHFAKADGPRQILIRVNAGSLPADHWLNDLEEGGGRLIGEGCHFVDLACWLAEAIPSQIAAFCSPQERDPIAAAQNFTISLRFDGGSLATILYSADGAPGLSKEYIEMHAGQRSGVIDDFRRAELWSGRRRDRIRLRRQDKGHGAQFAALHDLLDGNRSPGGPDPLDTMAATLKAADTARLGAEPPVAG